MNPDEMTPERIINHLEGMRQAPFWTDEDMAPVDAAIAAIAAGNAYILE